MTDASQGNPGTTPASAFMTPDPRVVHIDNTLLDAAVLMRDLDVGSLFVVDGDLLRGVVTDRDVAVRSTGEGREPITTTVEDIMTHDVVHVRETATLDDVLDTMARQRIRRVAVTDAHDQLCGVVALADIVCMFADYLPVLAAIARISEPFPKAKEPMPYDHEARPDEQPSKRGGYTTKPHVPHSNPPGVAAKR